MNGVNPNRPAAGARDDDPVGDPRATRRLYLASGIEGVSARKIAREARCSPTAIYLYFRSVPDLLEHLRMEGHAILTARLRDVPAASAPDRLREMGRAYFRFGLEHPGFYALMFRRATTASWGPTSRTAISTSCRRS